MEALLMVLDGMAMVLVVYMGLADDRRPHGARMKSLFRMTEGGGRRVDNAAEERRRLVAQSRGAGSRT